MKHKSRLLRPASSVACLTAALLVASSCSMVKQTLDMESRVFVRVPAVEIHPPADAGGWSFRHVVEGPARETPGGLDKTKRSQWYVAWRKGDDRDVLTKYGILPPWKRMRDMAPEIADACRDALGAYPNLIEPGLIFKQGVADIKPIPNPLPQPPAGTVPVVEVDDLPHHLWPSRKTTDGYYDPNWHLDDEHTELASARNRVLNSTGKDTQRIRIGILDTGFDERHVAAPRHLLQSVNADVTQALRPENEEGRCDESCQIGRTRPGQSLGSHGTGTIGILAGQEVELVDRDHKGRKPAVFMDEQGHGRHVALGAAPDAEIVPVRVAAGVASLSTANFAHGIDYASRVKKCDVLSMSHGGSPSLMWADAVNAAYQRGTAMFAATGDYFTLFPGVPGPLGRTGVIVPSSCVYPAAWRRVMSVAGVTEGDAPYALTDKRYYTRFWDLRGLQHHFQRGSYGADDVKRSIFDGRLSDEHGKTDPSMVRRSNELRSNPVCGYSHAVPWLEAGSAADATAPDKVKLSGTGTSSATPQVAAAAAHWLTLHRPEIPEKEWESWRKVESVYTAMTLTADRPWEKDSCRAPADQKPDPLRGAGIVKANKMLGVSYLQATQVSGSTLHFPFNGKSAFPSDPDGKEFSFIGTNGVPRDYNDGTRSFFSSTFQFDRRNASLGRDRKPLYEWEAITSESKRHEALYRLFHNMLLVEQWQLGVVPLKLSRKHTNPQDRVACDHPECVEERLKEDQMSLKIERRAKELADAVPPPHSFQGEGDLSTASTRKLSWLRRIFGAR